MRSLEIRTQRIFNNLIKQSQKLGSDSVLKETITMSSVQSPASKVYRPGSRVQGPESSVQTPSSSVQNPASRVQLSESSVHSPTSTVQRRKSSFQLLCPESSNSGLPK